MNIPDYGIILESKVDINFLKSLEPQFFGDEYIKFVIDLNQNAVCIGMEVHASCTELLREMSGKTNLDDSGIWGGNLYYDGHVVWTSTLNVKKNLALKEYGDNPRVISNEEVISRLTEVLLEKVAL